MRPTDKDETPTQYAANVKQWRERELAQDKETMPAREKLAQFEEAILQDEDQQLGAKLAEVLGLKLAAKDSRRFGRPLYQTEKGLKSQLGLARLVRSVLEGEL